MASQTYSGSCHCKANQYTIDISPPLEDGNKTISCNCSICTVNGYLLTFVNEDDIKWSKGGLQNMKSYSFGNKKLSHFFCPECGSSIGAQGEMGGKKMTGLNVRAMEGVDLDKLTLNKFDGKSL